MNLLEAVILIFLLTLTACVSHNRTVIFSPSEVDALPYEMAIDAVTSFNKASVHNDAALCVFSETAVSHKNGGAKTPYANTCFRDTHLEVLGDTISYIFVLDSNSGTIICNSRLATSRMDDGYFRDKFRWLGTALLSLGSEYCPEAE